MSLPVTGTGSWVFDESVAQGFFQEALNNIPDYVKVVDLCVDWAKKNLSEEAFILDVGSALGFSVDKLIESGFKHTFGVEKSISMARFSAHPEQIFISEFLPDRYEWDLITANWTLHFIEQRKDYLRSIYCALKHGGSLILTDKMDGSEDDQKNYWDFKLQQGMTLLEIHAKASAIKGVLNTKALSWYLDTLAEIGFIDIQIINNRFMFNTIYCKK